MRLTAAALRTLATSAGFARLRSLRLGNGSFADRDLTALVASPLGQGLSRLGVRGRLWDAGAVPVPNLRVLEVEAEHCVRAEFCLALCDSPRLAGLRELHANPTRLGWWAKGVPAALRAAFGPRLRPRHLWATR